MADSRLTPAGRALIAVVGLGILGYAAWRYGLNPGGSKGASGTGSPSAQPSGSPRQTGDRIPLPVLFGTEKEKWLRAAVEDFGKANPDVAVELRGVGTIESVRAIVEGKERPVVWSPADDIAVNLLEAEWALGKGGSPVDREGGLAPQPLVLTPLVLVAWEDRARALAAAGKPDPADWKTLHALATAAKGWSGLGAPAEWGFVKIGHTAPNASNSGLQALVLMAYAYHGKTAGLTAEDVLDEGFQKFLREIEKAVGTFGASSGTYMRDMVLFGPSKYDMIWNYESVAIGDMSAAQGRWGRLKVFYPRPTLWSNHPFVVLKGDWVSPKQRDAAKRLRDFLLTPAVQEKALAAGFRPANPDVKVIATDPANPFNKMKDDGIRVDIPQTAEVPRGEVARLLLETWRRNVPSAGR